jgi:RNA recognition motif-containing protein
MAMEAPKRSKEPRYDLVFTKPHSSIFVSGFNFFATEENIRSFFSKYGKIIAIWFPLIKEGRNGAITFQNENAF